MTATEATAQREQRKPILCLDFDGVLHSYTSGWKGANVIPDPPVPGAIEFMRAAAERFDVHVFSSRSNQEGGIQAMRSWLFDYCSDDDFAFNVIKWPTEKPAAMVSIDDRCLTFTGEWPSIDELLAFKPWNKLKPGEMIGGAMAPEIEALRRINTELGEQLEGYQRTFTSTYKANMRAIAMWHRAGGDPLTWPDHAELVVWLLEQRAPGAFFKRCVTWLRMVLQRMAQRLNGMTGEQIALSAAEENHRVKQCAESARSAFEAAFAPSAPTNPEGPRDPRSVPLEARIEHRLCRSQTALTQSEARTWRFEPTRFTKAWCEHCGAHFAASEFTWADTGETLGA